MQYNRDGHNKRTMESDRAHNCRFSPEERSPRSPIAGSAGGLKWDIMDIANRSALERFAAKVSAIPDMPQAVPAMGSTRRLSAHCPRACTRPV